MRSILKRKSLLAVDLSLPMRLRGHFKWLSKGASKFGQWVAPRVPFWGVYKRPRRKTGKKHSWSANEFMECVSPLVSTSPDMPNQKASSFEVYRVGAERAVQWPSCSFHREIGYAGYTSASFTHAWEKNPPQHKILRLSGIPMRPSRKSSGIVKKIHPKWVRNIESPHTHQLVQDFTHQNCTPWFCWGSHCAPSFASSSPRRYLRLQPASKFGPNGIFQVQKKGWMWSLANQKGSKLKRFGLNKIENSWCFICLRILFNLDFSGYQFFLLKEKPYKTPCQRRVLNRSQ